MVMEIIEGTSVEIPAHNNGWQGDFPFFLVIEPDDGGGNVGIDLDEGGWISRNDGTMRKPGTWLLYLKDGGGAPRPFFAMVVEEGEQPYFTKHHVGSLMSHAELTAIGIGKKYRDGTMMRLWVLPNGIICGGDDVDVIASRMLGG